MIANSTFKPWEDSTWSAVDMCAELKRKAKTKKKKKKKKKKNHVGNGPATWLGQL